MEAAGAAGSEKDECIVERVDAANAWSASAGGNGAVSGGWSRCRRSRGERRGDRIRPSVGKNFVGARAEAR